MFCSLIIFTLKQPLPQYADPTSIPQFCVIYNFSALSILVSCMPAALPGLSCLSVAQQISQSLFDCRHQLYHVSQFKAFKLGEIKKFFRNSLSIPFVEMGIQSQFLTFDFGETFPRIAVNPL